MKEREGVSEIKELNRHFFIVSPPKAQMNTATPPCGEVLHRTHLG